MALQLARDTGAPDRRVYPRIPVAVAGKIFFPDTDAEQDCIVTDISLGGVALKFREQPEAGTAVVLYMPGFDRVSGAVTRAGAENAAMRFDCSDAKRERLAEKIERYLAGELPADTRTRQSGRAALPVARHFRRSDGEIVTFEVCDISLTGASLKTAARPPIGEIVTIGSAAGRVTRHFDGGIALEFIRLSDAR